MYTVIAFKNYLNQNGNWVRIYDDSTEKSFMDKNDADEYLTYLQKVYQDSLFDTYEKVVYQSGELDITALKKEYALSKLDEEEKQILNIQE